MEKSISLTNEDIGRLIIDIDEIPLSIDDGENPTLWLGAGVRGDFSPSGKTVSLELGMRQCTNLSHLLREIRGQVMRRALPWMDHPLEEKKYGFNLDVPVAEMLLAKFPTHSCLISRDRLAGRDFAFNPKVKIGPLLRHPEGYIMEISLVGLGDFGDAVTEESYYYYNPCALI